MRERAHSTGNGNSRWKEPKDVGQNFDDLMHHQIPTFLNEINTLYYNTYTVIYIRCYKGHTTQDGVRFQGNDQCFHWHVIHTLDLSMPHKLFHNK